MKITESEQPQPIYQPFPRRPRVVPPRMRIWAVWSWLIFISVVVFIVDVLARGQLTHWGEFSVEQGLHYFQFWRLLTFQFLHAGPIHLLFNMLWLYFLGPIVEPWLGKRRFIAFYLGCGVVAGLTSALMGVSHLLPSETPQTALVGASGGIFGIMAAAATIAPHFQIHLILPPVSISIRAMLWIAIGLALFTIWTGGFNAGGEAAHIGGAVAGYLLVKQRQWLAVISGQHKRSRFWQPGDPPERFFRKSV